MLLQRLEYQCLTLLSFQRRQKETTASVLNHPIPLAYKQTLAPSFPSLPFLSNSGSPSSRLRATGQDASDPVAADSYDPHVKACMQSLIASYLNYRGYSDTARSFRKQREEERKQWRDVLSESSASFAAAAANANSEALAGAPSGSSTPAKKKSKKKAEGGSKKLLKSALRTTLSIDKEAGNESQMEVEDGQSKVGPPLDEDEEMQSATEQSSSSTAKPSRSASVRDDYMTTDAKHNLSKMDDLEADEAELEDTLHRQDICSALRRGRIDYAMQQVEEHYPGVVHPSSREDLKTMLTGMTSPEQDDLKRRRADLLFRLRCRKFVELVLASAMVAEDDPTDIAMDTELDEDEQVASQLISANVTSAHAASSDAPYANGSLKGKGKAEDAGFMERSQVSFEQVLSYGSQLNSLYPATNASTPPYILSKLKLLFSLVAYSNPGDLASHGNKAIYELTRQEERDELAEDVNKAMLESKGQPGIPRLELIYKQAHAVRDVLGDVFGDGRAALLGSAVE